MKNPNPRQLHEKTVQYWLTRSVEILAHIRSIKKDIANGDNTEAKRDALAQWEYIAYRANIVVKETVIFT